MKPHQSIGWLAAALAAAAPPAAFAWHAPGHDLATRAAVAALPTTMPEFFRGGADTIAHAAADPDTWTRPIGPRNLHLDEAAEHYFDLEPVADIKLPPARYEFLETLYRNKLKPAQVGLLPYAISDWTARLTVAFAEHRAWPEDPAIRAKCLVYAGLLAHYAEDLCQPLHSTIHYDGRVTPANPSPRTGIHMKLDALLGKLDISPAQAARGIPPAEFDDVLAAAMAELRRSHALVDRVYIMEKDLPAYEAPLRPDTPADEFARERLATSAEFTARLFLTAWTDSARLKFPDWHARPPQVPGRAPAPTSQPAGAE